MRKIAVKVSVFEYTDYRLFMRDRYRSLKASQRNFTYATIAKEVGFSSPGFITQIMQGATKLPATLLPGFCTALQLTKKESAYFSLLVEFAHAHDQKERMTALKKLIASSAPAMRGITADRYELFKEWYYVALHDLLHFYRFDGDYKALSRKLKPAISPSQAKNAIELLERLGLITKQPDGFYARTSGESLTTGHHDESVIINNYLIEMMKRAQESIETTPAINRAISTVSLSLSEQGRKHVESAIKDFRQRLFAIAHEDSQEDQLIQVNIQMFPLSEL